MGRAVAISLVGMLLALGLGAGAQSGHRITLVSFPPNAEIRSSSGQSIGTSGDGADLPGQPFEMIADPIRVTLRSPGHQDLSVTLYGADVASGRYPAKGELSLVPLTQSQRLTDLWLWRRGSVIALGLLGFGGLAALAALYSGARGLRRRHARQAVLESYAPTPGADSTALVLSRIGSYRVLKLLGKGGMSEVYLAVPESSLSMGGSVAIKILNDDLREKPDAVERFEREVSVTSELLHPGIVGVIEWGWQSGRLYLVMEHVQGCELRQLIPDLQRDQGQAMKVLGQVMEAVEYAHSRGISHRDLKPENVMVTPTGRAKVMDFGLGRAVDSKTLTRTGSALGSPRYIAPEAISGKHVDERADQYSLGVMAYELLAGRLPFDGDQVLQLLYSHSHLEPEPPSSISSLPEAVDAVILRMMKKQPAQRYRSVQQAHTELRAALGWAQ